MAITIVSHDDFNKAYIVTTGAGNYNLPREDVDSLYSSGWPIAPVTRPEDSDLPRVIDYPVGINYTLQPRIGYQGLMPIAALKSAYGNIAEVSQPVNLIIRELCGFTGQFRDKKTKKRVKDGYPLQYLAEKPDGRTPFNVWMTRYKKSAKIYAAPAFYKRRDCNKIYMEYIDGSTFFLIVNARGELPEPNEVDPELLNYMNSVKSGRANIGAALQGLGSAGYALPGLGKMMGDPSAGNDRFQKFKLEDFLKKARAAADKGVDPNKITTPAFTQVIKGVPFSFWDKSQVYFVPEPPASSTDTPYGESYIERAWTWIQIVAVLTAFELGHYRTGNMPEGWATLPKDLFPTLAKIALYEKEQNARMAEPSQTAHSRVRYAPEGTKWIPTKKPDFPKDLYKQARENILLAIGVPVSEVEMPHSGLGGKGFGENSSKEVTRQILESEKEGLETAINSVLSELGDYENEYYMDYPQEEIDPTEQAKANLGNYKEGLITLNDYRSTQNQNPIGDPSNPDNAANMHLVQLGQSIVALEKIKFDENGVLMIKPPAGGNAGGSPFNPDDAAREGIKPLSDNEAQKLMRTIEDFNGRVTSVTYSLPTISKGDFEGHPFRGNQYGDGNKGAISHVGNITGAQMEAGLVEKRYRVEGDGPFRVVNIDTGKTVPGGEHDDKEKALAHLRALYANVPDANKSEIPIMIEEKDIVKFDWSTYFKHCGVCPEDSEYLGAPIVREIKMELPINHHANDVEVVAMTPDGLPPQPALWKPEGGEKVSLAEKVGGPQYLREEAVWLLDQSLGFHLVPLAYVAEVDGEQGAAIWYTAGNTVKKDPDQYAPEWIEKAAVLDYISSQQDRYLEKNYLTHPDDPNRVVLIDNGFSFPADPNLFCNSMFCGLMMNKPLSDDTLTAIKNCLNDAATWTDIIDLIGKDATDHARECAQRLLDKKMVTHYPEAGRMQ